MLKPGAAPVPPRKEMQVKRDEQDRQKAVHAQDDRGVVQLVDDLLNTTVTMKATDLHMEMVEDGARVRVRQENRELAEMSRPDPKTFPNMINRLKVLSNMDITNFKAPQRGYFKKEIEGTPVEFESYSFPALLGEKLVLKIHYKRAIDYSLDNLGMDPPVIEMYKNLLKKEQGLVVVAGPPGSGKNTTLYSSVTHLSAPTKNVCTCETIIKYNLPGAIQGRHEERSDFSYEDMLRALVLQEPDVLLLGDVKTPETARIAVHAAMAKRVVFARLVAGDTVNAIQVLLDMGVQSFLVASALQCVIAQRLVRKLCDGCKAQYNPSESLINEIGIPLKKDVLFYKAAGCDKCAQTGFAGTLGLFELFHPNEALRELIVARAPAQDIRQKATALGMVPLKRDGIKKAFLGLTTIDEVLNAL